jgi:type VI protein secretion system component VasK
MLINLLFISDMAMIIIVAIIALAFIIGWVKILYEINNSTFRDETSRILWLVFVVFMPLLGVTFYLLLGRKQRVRE